jgi:hypothetical protein
MHQTETDAILTLLRRWEATGRLGGAQLEYRTEDGQPPSQHRFEQLRLLAVNGRDTLQFATVAHARTYDPPELVLRFQLPAQPQNVQALARLIREAQVFTTRRVEQARPQRADTLTTEVAVFAPGGLRWRRYHGRIPEALARLREEVERLIRLVRTRGKLTAFHENFRLGADKSHTSWPGGPCTR